MPSTTTCRPFRTHVRFTALAGIVLVAFGRFPSTAEAGPVAIWTTPWNVDLETPNLGGVTAVASRAFGAPSTMDGQETDLGVAGSPLPDTDAVAKAKVMVGAASFSITQTADVRVDFDRPFILPKSATGFWNVTIALGISGTLSSSGPSSSAGVQALFKITDSSGATIAGDNVSFNDGVTGTLTRASTGTPTKTFILPDGIYHAVGFLFVDAMNTSNLTGSGASSNFFKTLDASVNASATPEPSSLIMAGIAGLASAAYIGWRRRLIWRPSPETRLRRHLI